MGEQEVNICSGCKQEDVVSRKYFYYDIKCDCCNSKDDPHFEIVYYCRSCVPFPPKEINVHIKPIKEFKHLLSKRVIEGLNNYSKFYGHEFTEIKDLEIISLSSLSHIRGFGKNRMDELKKFLTRHRIECKP